MPTELVIGGIISCIVCSLCGAFCIAKNKKDQRSRRGPPGPYGPQPQMYDQQQLNEFNEMEFLMQQQILTEKEEVERLRNYIRRQKRATADAILRQEAGLNFTPAPVVAPAAPAPVHPVMAMNGMAPRMVVCNPNPGCCGAPMSPFPQMPNPNMPPPPIPVYYLR